ncbi:hypothetical protein Drorol1_Dr00016751 [Drosera rotundifolia]
MSTKFSMSTKKPDRSTSTNEDTIKNTIASKNTRILTYSYSYTSFPSIETTQEEVDDDQKEEEEVFQEAEESVVKPSILNLLEPLGQLYKEKKQMIDKISGFFHELLSKANSLVSGAGSASRAMRPQSTQRSLSLGSQGQTLDAHGVSICTGVEHHPPERRDLDVADPPAIDLTSTANTDSVKK